MVDAEVLRSIPLSGPIDLHLPLEIRREAVGVVAYLQRSPIISKVRCWSDEDLPPAGIQIRWLFRHQVYKQRHADRFQIHGRSVVAQPQSLARGVAEEQGIGVGISSSVQVQFGLRSRCSNADRARGTHGNSICED